MRNIILIIILLIFVIINNQWVVDLEVLQMKNNKRYRFYIIIFSLVILMSNILNVYASDTEYKTFIQSDERWGSYPYEGDQTIAYSGCMITAVAILMAYANPDLRDVNTFNPMELAKGLSFAGGIIWGSTKNVDPTFTLKSNNRYEREILGRKLTASEAINEVRGLLDNGYYVIVCTQGLYDSGDHYSPVVGWDEENNKPIVWDVAGGGKTWDDWANLGIDQMLIYESSLNPSSNTLGNSEEAADVNRELTDEQKAAVESVIAEWELRGMPEGFSFESNVSLPDYENSLSMHEKIQLAKIRDGIDTNKTKWYDIAGVLVSFFGLLVMLYGVLFGVAYMFDSSNILFDVSLLAVITLGKYRYWSETCGSARGYNDKEKIMYCDGGIVLKRVIVIEVIGMLIIGGGVFNILYQISSVLGGLV